MEPVPKLLLRIRNMVINKRRRGKRLLHCQAISQANRSGSLCMKDE
jgi:hypothetical protein